jgi:hypothetical protein
MANYIGNQPLHGEFKRLDSIESQFNGSTATFTLKYNTVTQSAGDASQLIVSLNGVVQEPLGAYTLGTGGSTLTFSTAPQSGDTCHIVMLGGVGATATPTDNSVTAAKIVDGAVTSSKISIDGDISFPDNDKAVFGDGTDLTIFSDGGTYSYINNTSGNLRIRNTSDDNDVIIQSDNGSGGVTDYFIADGSSGQSQMLYYGSLKLNTNNSGINVTGTVVTDGLTVNSGTSNTTATFQSTDAGAYINFTDTTGTSGIGNDTVYLYLDADKDNVVAGSQIRLRVDGSTKLTVKDNGNVGIGTTNPAENLHINGGTGNTTVLVESTDQYVWTSYKDNSSTSDYTNSIGGTGDNLQIISPTISLRTGTGTNTGTGAYGTERLTITSSGSVGIGTDSPTRKLHVNGSGRFDMAAGTVRISEQQSMVSVQGVNDAETAFTDLKIDGSKIILQAQSGGTVGIDNASPGHYLHIGNTNTADSTKRYGIRIERHGNSTTPGVWDNSSGQGAIQISDTSGNGPATVENNSGVLMMGFGRMAHTDTGAENASIINVTYDGQLGPMRLDGKGNLWTGYDRGTAETNTNAWQGIFRGGILVGSNSTYRTGNADGGALIQGNVAIGGGNGTAARRLDVRGGTDYQQARFVSVNQGGSAGIEFTDELGFSQIGYLRWTHSDGNTATNTGQSGNASFVIGSTEADNVIGFNSGMTDTGYGNNRGSIKYTSSGTTYNTSSDRRLKENIELITDGKEKLLAMKPSTFNFINDENKTKMHGFIAQEMQEVIPEAVSDGTTMGMDYGRITPVIVAALQDALKEIEELKMKIQNLENSND